MSSRREVSASVRPRERVLRPVRPSAATEQLYRARLLSLIDEMDRSVTHWLTATYRRAEPRIVATDAAPSAALSAEMRRLSRQWTARFDEMAAGLARWFSRSVERRTTSSLRRILREGGMAVEFRPTRALRDVMDATVAQTVQLIRSIPAQYLGQVQGIVQRGVQSGRDLGVVSAELRRQLGVTRRRAALIARDQNNKATAAYSRARQLEAGLDEAVWVHSGGGREPRPTHLKAGRERTRYKISEGWFDPHEKRFIQPGELINCRCTARPVVLGFS